MTSLPSLEALATRWESHATLMRSYGATTAGDAITQCAEELRIEIATFADVELTYEDAAEESGYSVSHLRRLVREGTLHDYAETGETKLRRGDLPRKAKKQMYPTLRTA